MCLFVVMKKEQVIQGERVEEWGVGWGEKVVRKGESLRPPKNRTYRIREKQVLEGGKRTEYSRDAILVERRHREDVRSSPTMKGG